MQRVLQRRRERQYVMTSICEVVCASDRVLWPIDTVCISKQGNGVITMSGITMQCSLCILRVFTLITTSLSMLESKIVSLKNMLLTDIHNWSLWSMISPSSLLLGSNLRPLPFKCLVCHQKCPILASCCLFACLFVGKLSVISCLLFICCCLFVSKYSSNERPLLFYCLVCHYWLAVTGQRVPILSATKPVLLA